VTAPHLRGARVTLRPATVDDVDALHRVLGDPSIATRWIDVERGDCEEILRDPEVEPFLVELDGDVVGYIQYGEEADAMYRHASIDVSIMGRWQGQGLGSDAVRTLARYLIGERGHHRIVIDPAADNVAAIRCYEKVGFLPVGVMRAYERGADGSFHDGLLMDLLAGELT
jgi:aminoglycoside 6'-N-acetyltransferase